MVVGNSEPKQAVQVDLKKVLSVCLDEALTALEESFHDLSDEQIWAKPLPGRHSIVTIVMHLLESADRYTCKFQTGKWMLKHEDRFDIWQHSEEELRDRQKDLPTVSDLLLRLNKLREAALPALESAGEQDLLGRRCCAGWWVKERGRSAADAYMRIMGHTMAHVRQIWLMRGAMGLTDKDGWPEQHWA